MQEQILEKLGEVLAKEMQQQLVDLKSYKSGALYRSITVDTTSPTHLDIRMLDYGPWLNDGHRTRLGTSKKANYQPKALHSMPMTKPKPFINNAVEQVLQNESKEFIEQAKQLVLSQINKEIK